MIDEARDNRLPEPTNEPEAGASGSTGYGRAGRAWQGAALAEIDALLATLGRLHHEAGYREVSPPELFPAEVMLSLYGEDVRGRAFLFPGGGSGEELCLRPDFTVPVAIMHGAAGWQRAAKYAYQGPVFRRQPQGSSRPIEYLQAGIENIGAADPAAAEAQILALTLNGLEALGAGPVDVVTGDLGIVFALLEALDMPVGRRALLRRHVWRPTRFARLVEAAQAAAQARPAHTALLTALDAGETALQSHLAEGGEILGVRGVAEVAARAAALAAAADEPPMSSEQAALIDAVLGLQGEAGDVLASMRTIAAEAGVDIGRALDAFERRLDAFNRAGLDGEALRFDASFGRTLEYYDGFVFELTAPGRPELPSLAGGGRYDSLTARLGAQRAIPAVGAIIRPEAVLAARADETDDHGAPKAFPRPFATALPAAGLPPASAIPGGDVVMALPSKGRLQEATIDWFAARGITIRRTGGGREYAAEAEGVPGLGVAMLSAGEIPAALEAGLVHLGITGLDLVEERIAAWQGRLSLAAPMGFGHADLVVAVPGWWRDVTTMADLDDAAERFRARHGHALRIATKYHNLTRQFFRANGVADYRIVDSQGATEAAPKNQSAEALVDITTTGETLRANHLRQLDDGVILRSEACLFVARKDRLPSAAKSAAAQLMDRLGIREALG
ncbi:MAG: ATP phosphoribosyltransferase [Pseudomonadota bacterium]